MAIEHKPADSTDGNCDPSLQGIVAAPRSQSGFSLGALLLLLTVCGVFAAYVVPLGELIRKNQRPFPDYVVSGLIAGSVAMLIGGIIGGMQRRPVVGILLGLPIGAVIGMILGPLALAPIESFPVFLRASLFGSITVLVVAALFRRL